MDEINEIKIVTPADRAAQKIAEYLTEGMHPNTPEGRAEIVKIIQSHFPAPSPNRAPLRSATPQFELAIGG